MTQEHDPYGDHEAGTTMDLSDRVSAGHPGDQPYLPRTGPAPAGRASVEHTPVQQWYLHGEDERHIRSRGRWLITGGAALGGLCLALSIVWHAGFGRPMPIAYLLPFYLLAFGAVTVGCTEVLTRSTRAQYAHTAHAVESVSRGLHLLVGLMGEELQQQFYRAYGAAMKDMQQTGTGPIRTMPRPPAGTVTPFQRTAKRGNGR